jgi:hypothetical protein
VDHHAGEVDARTGKAMTMYADDLNEHEMSNYGFYGASDLVSFVFLPSTFSFSSSYSIRCSHELR